MKLYFNMNPRRKLINNDKDDKMCLYILKSLKRDWILVAQPSCGTF